MKKFLLFITYFVVAININCFSQLISNGNFSTYTGSNQHWAQWGNFYFSPTSSNCYTSSPSYAYFSNPNYSWTNIINNNESGYIYQTVQIPPSYSNLNLSFNRSINTTDGTTSPYDYLYVRVKNNSGSLIQTLATYSNVHGSTSTSSCQSYTSITISNFPTNLGGQFVRIYFEATNDPSNPTVFRIDDVSLTYTVPSCTNWSVSPASQPVPQGGGSYTANVTASGVCGYSVSTASSWIHPIANAGGLITYTVDPNFSTNTLNGYINVNNTTNLVNNVTSLQVTQSPCTPPTSPSTAYANGSSGSITMYDNVPLTLTKSGGNLNSSSNAYWEWYEGNSCAGYAIGQSVQNNASFPVPQSYLTPGPHQFFVVGFNACGNSLTCASVDVVVQACDPITWVTLTPNNPDPVVQVGGDVPLQASVTGGTGPYNYVWYKNNTPLPNNNSPIYIIYSAAQSDEGDYKCKVSNCYGVEWSNQVTLTVNCATWTNSNNDPVYKNKYEYLCSLGILNSATAKLPDDEISRLDLAIALKQTLQTVSSTYINYANSFPTPFLDTDIPVGADAIQMMLYLDYGDNISPFSRDYFNVQPNLTFNNGTGAGSNNSIEGIRGAGLRALMEAFNIAPNWQDYNPTSDATSAFANNIKLNNPYYGYYKKAFLDLNWISYIPGTNNIDQAKLTYEDIVKAIYSVKHDNNPVTVPSIVEANYFIPNNFTKNNSSAGADLSRGCFSNYSEEGISINRGGIPIEFKPIYNSHLFEIPKAGIWLDDSLKFYQEVAYPLRQGWTHSLNIYIIQGLSYNAPSNNSYLIHWPDGRIHVVNYTDKSYVTKGVNDVFSINSAGNLVVTTIDKTQYIFGQVSNLQKMYRLIEIKDRNNNSLYLSYNTNVKGYSLKGIKNGYSGDSIQVFCGTNSRLIDSVKFAEKKLSFVRNTDYINLQSYGDLIKYFNAKGDSTVYTYASDAARIHLLTNITRPNGNIIDNQYDARRKLSQSKVGNYITNITFNTNYTGNANTTQSLIQQTGNGGTVTTNVVHNNNGVPTSLTTSSSNVSRIGTIYHTQSNNTNSPVMVLDSNTNIKHQYTYNANGLMLSHTISHPNITPMTETWTINSSHDLWGTYTDMNGVTATRAFDSYGNVQSVSNSAGGLVTGSIQTQTSYLLGQPVQSYDGYTTVNYGYNTKGLMTSVSIPSMNITSTASYDVYGRLTKTINPYGVKDSSEYDLNDNVTKTLQDVGGLNLATNNTYDRNDNVLSVTAPKGDQTTFSYDPIHDYLTQVQYSPFNQTMTYNTDGSMASLKNKNNHLFNYSYYSSTDARAGMLQSDGYKTINVNATTKWVDNITNAANNTITYTYDELGRAKEIEYNDVPNNKVQYEYENLRLRKIIYPFGLGEQTMVYDNASGLLQYLKWNGVTYVEYKYRGDKNLLEEIYYSKIHKLYYYDNAARLDSVVYKKQNGTKLAGFKLVKDAVGNLIFDSSYVNVSFPTAISHWTGGVNTRSYDNMNRCTLYNGQTNSYNGNGCLEHFGMLNADYTYDQQDNMLSRSIGSNLINMTVDPLEHRRTFGATRYFLDLLNNENILAEKNTNTNQFTDIYLYGFGKFCRIDPNTQMPSFYLTDYRGSVIAIVDGNENISHYYYYQNGVQGKLDSSYVSSTTGFPNNTLFVGAYGVVTHDSSLVYMRARYYNPMIGNFYSEDPIWSTNLFAYANNNPGDIDPNGENPLLIAMAVGAVWNVAEYYITTPKSERTSRGVGVAALKSAIKGGAYLMYGPATSLLVDATMEGISNSWNATNENERNKKFFSGFGQTVASNMLGNKLLGKTAIKSAARFSSRFFSSDLTTKSGRFAKSFIEEGYKQLRGNISGNIIQSYWNPQKAYSPILPSYGN